MKSQSIYVDSFPVLLTRKRIKNIHLRVKPPDGHVEVSAPSTISLEFICDFVRSKHDWIVRQQKVIENSIERRAEQATEEEKQEWKLLVSACVPVLIEAWEPIMGVKAGKLVFREMKSRWGSCQPSTGRICINTRLALYPPECLEYVVVHELCHLLERGHGRRFYEYMDLFMPDWRQRRAQLR